MKKLLISIVLLLVFLGCETKSFKGFLVCKEYIPGHMDNEQPYIQQEAYMLVPIVPPRRHVPKYVPSVWVFYVANKDCVKLFYVDSLKYQKYKVGQRIVMNRE